MENRRNRRTPAVVKLLLFKDGVMVAIGSSRDVSSGGLFVQTDYIDLDPLQPVEIELLSNHWTRIGGIKRHQGFVVHMAADGFGLRFEEIGSEERRAVAAGGGGARTSSRASLSVAC